MSLRTMNRGQRRAALRQRVGAAPLLAKPAPMANRLEIGALVLRGFERRTGLRVAAAFERQMAELMQGSAVPAQWRGLRPGASLRGDRVRVAAVSDPVAMGERLAVAVFRSQVDDRRVRDAGRGGEA